LIDTILNSRALNTAIHHAGATKAHELEAVLRGVYPLINFSLVGLWEGWHRDGGIVDMDQRRIAFDRKAWLRELVRETGDDPRAAWTAVKPKGYLATRWQGRTFIFTAPFGRSTPEDFFQVMIEVEVEIIESLLVEDHPPDDLDDLLSPICLAREPIAEISAPKVQVARIFNVSQLLGEMAKAQRSAREKDLPNLQQKTIPLHSVYRNGRWAVLQDVPFLEARPQYLDEPIDQLRMIRDWAGSSPGKSGKEFCRHWYFDAKKFLLEQGKTTYNGCIPCWAIGKGAKELPELRFRDNESPFLVMDQLERFDQKVGHPFSWFFYMLHGNRITANTGEIVVAALRHGDINLPDHDAAVLFNWHDNPYGF